MQATQETHVSEQTDGKVPAGLTIHLPGASWEMAAYAALVLVALVMRVWDLGPRAYHHDESLHAYYSWQLYSGQGFSHNPLLHGPFLFDVTALGLLLFGDTLAAPRIFPALFGTVLVIMPFFLRSRLGKWGALAAAVMLAFSPSIFYFSRFIREDIFAIVLDFGVVIAMWRYLETRKNRYIYLGAAFLALTFSEKESAFMTAAILASFLLLWWSQRWLPILWTRVKGSRVRRLRARLRFSRMPPSAGFLILIVTMTLPLFSAAVGFVVQRFTGLTLVNAAENYTKGPVGAPLSGVGGYTAAGLIAGILFIIAIALGYRWGKSTWLIAFGVFYSVYFMLHTTFLTNMVGLGSGVWASLGYWIAQQSVARGNQPWYYYLIMLPLYEFLPFFVGLAGVGLLVRKMDWRSKWWALATAIIASLLAVLLWQLTESKLLFAPLTLAIPLVTWMALSKGGDPFDWFLAYWALMSVLLYIVAGEKMPWLLPHLALPFILLSGKLIGQASTKIEWSRTLKMGGLAVLFLAPVLLLCIRALVLASNSSRPPVGGWAFVGALAFTAAFIAVAWYLWARLGRRRFLQMSAVSVLAVAGFFTVRAGVQAAYSHGDIPVEMLVYTQTSPDIARLMERIDIIAEQTGKGKELSITIDTADGFGWPWFWYLRNYKKVSYVDLSAQQPPPDSAIVVANASNKSRMAPVADQYNEVRTIPFRQWFPEEEYREYTPSKFFGDVFSTAAWSRGLNFFTYRKLNQPLGHIDSVVYYSKSLPATA